MQAGFKSVGWKGLLASCPPAHGRFDYDFVMRRLFLCFLLCLMPLRLWAGVGMLIAPNGWHPTPTPNPTSASTPISVAVESTGAQTAPAQSGHDCHEAVTLASHEAPTHTTHVADHGPQTADCHDGSCQLCGVCHQTASLMTWVLGVPLIQIHPQPIGAFVAPLAQPAQPLIKPPIS